MSAFRNKPRRGFTIVRNDALRNPNISLKAKGLLAQMLSFPDDWEYHVNHLETLNTDGRDGMRTAMRELMAQGYVTRTQMRAETGKVGAVVYEVTDEPTADGFSVAGKPAPKKTDNTNTDKDLKTLVEKTHEPRPPRESATPTRQIEEIIQAWNDNCGTLPKITILNQHRKRRIQNLIREHNGTAAQLITDATRNVANNPYWQENRYTFDNLLAGGKYLSHAEAHQTTQQPRARINHEVPF
jgi:hypothetical protein